MSYNYQVVLFKNKVKKKIINKFKTYKKANELYISLIEKSDVVIFNKKYENGRESLYELALLEKTSGTLLPMFMKDTFGRQVKVNLDDNDFSIIRISMYNLEELIVDYSTNTRITISDFIKKYLNPPGLKMVSKLNNKVIVQNDDH